MKTWMITLGAAVGVFTGALWRWHERDRAVPPPTPIQAPHIEAPREAAEDEEPTDAGLQFICFTDKEDVKEAAWRKASARMEAADKEAAAQVEESIKIIMEFFAERKKNSKAFAESMLGLKGKWELMRSSLNGDPSEYQKFLLEKFEAYLFQSKDIKDVMEASIKAHISAIEGLENKLLVDLRSDIDGLGDSAFAEIPAARSEDLFKQAFQQSRKDVIPLLNKELRISVGQEVLGLIATDLATKMAWHVGGAVVGGIGMSQGKSGSGNVVTTLGSIAVTIVVGLIIDQVLDQILKSGGHDPAAAIAERVNKSLDDTRDSLIFGHPDAVGICKAAKALTKSENAAVRQEAAKTIDVIEKSGALGLRRELEIYSRLRQEQRQKALKQLIYSSGGN